MALQSVRSDRDTIMQRIKVFIILLSDVRPSDDEYLCPLDSGRELEIKVKWPRSFYDT